MGPSNFKTATTSLLLTFLFLLNSGDTAQETFSKITAGDYDFENEEFDDISEEAKGFIRHLLVGKMEERLTAEECLHHPWLRYEPKSSFSKKYVHLNNHFILHGCLSFRAYIRTYAGFTSVFHYVDRPRGLKNIARRV